MNEAQQTLLPEAVLEWCRLERQAAVTTVADYVTGEVRLFQMIDGGGLIDVTQEETGVLEKRIRTSADSKAI